MKGFIITLVVIVIVIIVGLGIFYYMRGGSTNSQTINNGYNNAQSAQNSTGTVGTATEPQDLISMASQAGMFKTFVAAVLEAGMQDSLKSGGPYTVFVPTDSAFGKLDQTTMQKLVNDKQFLQGVLKNHIVSGAYFSSDLVDGQKLTNLSGGQLMVSSTGVSTTIAGANIVNPNIIASNGTIQGIDKVIISQ